MAIIVQPNFDTRINPSVGTPNVINEGDSVTAERIAQAGKMMQEAGQKLYANAREQARMSQLRDAQEAYNISLTKESVNASKSFDPNTGKIDKNITSQMFSDYIAERSDALADEIASSRVEEPYREEFRNLIASEKQRAKVQAIVFQAEGISKSAGKRIEDDIISKKSSMAVFNRVGENPINEAIRLSDEMSIAIHQEVLNGNMDNVLAKDKGANARAELTEPLLQIIVDKQNPEELIDFLGADIFVSDQMKHVMEDPEFAGSDIQSISKELYARADMRRGTPAEALRQKMINEKITITSEQKQKVLREYFSVMLAKNKSNKEGTPDLLKDVITTNSDPSSTPSELSSSATQLRTHNENLDKSNAPLNVKLASRMQADIALELGRSLKLNPLRTASQREVQADRAIQKTMDKYKKKPEYAAFLKSAPVFGATFKESAMGMQNAHDKRLQIEFTEDPSNFLNKYHADVRSSWKDAFGPGSTPQKVQAAMVVTETKWRKFAEGRGIRSDDMKYKIIPPQYAREQDVAFENALASGDYNSFEAMRASLDKKGLTAQVAYRNLENKTPSSNIQNITQFMNPSLATAVAANWAGKEGRKELFMAGFKDDESKKEFNQKLTSFVSQNYKYFAIPGQETQAIQHTDNLKESILSEYTAELSRNSKTGDPLKHSNEVFNKVTNRVLSTMYTHTEVAISPTRTQSYVDPRLKPDALKRTVLFKGYYPSKYVTPQNKSVVDAKLKEHFKALMSSNNSDVNIGTGTAAGKLFNDIVVQEKGLNKSKDEKTGSLLKFYVDRGWFQYQYNPADETLDPVIWINGKEPATIRFNNKANRFQLKDAGR